MHQKLFLLLSCFLWLVACKHKADSAGEETAPEAVQTPVTVTTVSVGTITDSVVLNATSRFLQANIVKSSVNGYVKAVNTRVGQYTAGGKTLFSVQTKEAKNIGNLVNDLDPSFHFSGIIHIRAPLSGYVTELNHQAGDYVQDGEQLAVISDSRSFGFLLNLPYEYRPLVGTGKPVQLVLPDGRHLNGVVSNIMPTVDSASQTQAVLIKVNASHPIPQNLIAKVQLVKRQKQNAITLPKEAVLSDEAQENFWVMQLVDSVTAVKVPIIKGMETGNRVEVIRPQFTATDKIILTGNYGLSDTAKVKIVKDRS